MTAVTFQFTSAGLDGIVSDLNKLGTASTKAHAKIAKGAAQAAQETVRSTERAETARVREVERAAAKIEKLREKEARANEKAQKTTTKAAEKAAKDEARAREHVFQVKQRYLAAEERASRQKAATEKRLTEKTQGERQKLMMSVGGAALRTAAGLGLAAAGTVGAAAGESLKLQELSNRISINSRGAGKDFADPTALRREFEQTAIASPGVKSLDVAEAVQAFVTKTGNLDVARKMQGTFATVSSATGGNVKDIAGAAADLFEKFKITDINEMRDALGALTYQGKQGAFELSDAAKEFPKIAAAASRFGFDKGAGGLKTLGGLTQIARSSTGSAEQAGTAVEAMLSSLVAKAPKLVGSGVSVFNKQGKTRDIKDVLVETIAKTGGNNLGLKSVGLQEIFGEQGIRAVSPLISTYKDTFLGTKGTDAQKRAAAEKAIREQLESSIDVTGGWAEVQRDAAQAQKDASAQLTAAWEGLKAAVGREFTPTLIQVVPKLMALTPAIEPAITVFVAMAEAGRDVVDAFKFLGLIKPKVVSKQDALKSAQDELTTFDRGQGFAVPTAADALKREALLAKVTAAQEAIAPSPEAGALSNLSKLPGGRTKEEFVSQFAAASGFAPGSNEYKEAAAQAGMLDSGIRANPYKMAGGHFNDKQREVVQGRQEAMVAEVGLILSTMQQVNAEVAKLATLNESTEDFTSSAENAARALDRIGNSSGPFTPSQ